MGHFIRFLLFYAMYTVFDEDTNATKYNFAMEKEFVFIFTILYHKYTVAHRIYDNAKKSLRQ